MNVEREKMLQDAEEFERLVQEIMQEFPEMERSTAERVVIHTGHKSIEQLCMALFDVLVAYIDARGDNAAHLRGRAKEIIDRVRNKK